MKKIALWGLLMALTIGQARANLLIEPVLGYSFGKSKTDLPGNEETSGSGVSMGGRLGFQKLGFSLGLDYLRSSLDLGESEYKSNYVTHEWAAFLGFRFPLFFKVYAGYIFAGSGEVDYDDGTTEAPLEVSGASGTKLGVGFTGIPFVDLNFEYRRGTFDEYKFNNVKQKVDTEFSAYMVSISLPINL